jgi:hypothetical protein
MPSEKSQEVLAVALQLAVKDYLKAEADFAEGEATVAEANDFLLQFEVLQRIVGAARVGLKASS